MFTTARTILAALALKIGSTASADIAQAEARYFAPPDATAIIEQCRQVRCEVLNLDGAYVDDFTVLNDMTHVTALMVSSTNFDDLADIAGMTQLKELHMGFTAVTYLEGLAAFPQLELVHAHGLSNVVDMAPVFQMTDLRELSIDVPARGGLGALSDLDQLEALFVMGGTIDDLSPLRELASLQSLHIEAGLPEDVRPLLEISTLHDVTVHWWAVNDVVRTALRWQGIEVHEVPLLVEVLC